MLHINNLSVSVDDTSILKNLSLDVSPGKIHILMGPNGSGKSSLVYTLMGHPSYEVTSGSVKFQGENLLELGPHIRSQKGLYLSMQQPQNIAGLQVLSFLKEIYTIHKKSVVTIDDFMKIIRPLLGYVGLPETILQRSVNDGFSGGERKRFELLQMMLLKPKVALLDEIDSGVDVDGLRLIAQGLQMYQKENPDTAMIIVTHYRRILEYIKPDIVHVMMQGTIVKTGDLNLINTIEHKGYEQYAKRFE